MPVARNVTIVGVGLIGGSLAWHSASEDWHTQVVGCGRRQQSLDKALAVGAIDEGSTDLTEAVADAQIVVVASPVASVVDHVCRVARTGNAELITDVGSTKGLICRQIQTQLAGSENSLCWEPSSGGGPSDGPGKRPGRSIC